LSSTLSRVETLIERSFRVHVINPKRMERFRNHFALADSPFFNAK
jgi:hypothetical protein